MFQVFVIIFLLYSTVLRSYWSWAFQITALNKAFEANLEMRFQQPEAAQKRLRVIILLTKASVVF